jgi:hypothetical protein
MLRARPCWLIPSGASEYGSVLATYRD